jgi:hypothetical protein
MGEQDDGQGPVVTVDDHLAFSITSLPDLRPPTPLRKGVLTSLRSFAPHTLG